MDKAFIVLGGIINIWWALAIFESMYTGYCCIGAFWMIFGFFLLFVGILMTLYYARLHWPVRTSNSSLFSWK